MPVASGFISPYCAALETHTDAPAIYHRACALTLLGSMLTREQNRLILAYGSPKLWTTLWMVLVGDSGTDRKSACVNMGFEALMHADAVGAPLIGPRDGSPEGFLDHLVSRTRDPVTGPATLMFQPELVNLLKLCKRPYAESLKSLLHDLIDVIPEWYRKLKRAETRIPRPRLSMLGAINYTFLAKYSESDDWTGGFMSRCILITGRKTRTQQEQPQIPDGLYKTLGQRLAATVEANRQARIKDLDAPLIFSEDALRIMRQAEPESDDNVLAQNFSRFTTHFYKLAAIYQVDIDPTAPVVGKEAAILASEFLEHWIAHLPNIIADCYSKGNEDLAGDKLARRILHYVRRNGGRVRFRKILQNCALKKKEVEAALDSLIAAEWLSQELIGPQKAHWITLPDQRGTIVEGEDGEDIEGSVVPAPSVRRGRGKGQFKA